MVINFKCLLHKSPTLQLRATTLQFYCKAQLESIELGVAREPTGFVGQFWEKRPLGCFLIDSYIDLSVSTATNHASRTRQHRWPLLAHTTD